MSSLDLTTQYKVRLQEAQDALAELQLNKQAGDEVICGQATQISELKAALTESQAEVAKLKHDLIKIALLLAQGNLPHDPHRH